MQLTEEIDFFEYEVDFFDSILADMVKEKDVKKEEKKDEEIASNSTAVKSMVGNTINKRLMVWNNNGSRTINKSIKDNAKTIVVDYIKKNPKEKITEVWNKTNKIINTLHSRFKKAYIKKNV